MKNIIIVGASSGIGNRVARDFARMGWRVGVAARRQAPLKELQKEFPDSVVYRTIDVTLPDSVERFNNLIEDLGGMDVLLYATGTGFQNPTLDIEREVVTLETNVVGMARITLAAYRYFRDTANRNRGQIAVITSIAGTKGIGVAAAYSASKRFQNTYIEALEQLARRQRVAIDFTDIRPGFIRTALLNEAVDYPMIMTLDYVAPLIELAILRRQRVATLDWRWRLVTAAWRLIPRCLWVKMPVDALCGEPKKEEEPIVVEEQSSMETVVKNAARGIVNNDQPADASEADARKYLDSQPK